MNILMVGGGGLGSWTIRGGQLGVAMGARVTTTPTADDFKWSDVVVLVKRAGALWAREAHRHQRPIVWDALDFWRQPEDNHATEATALSLLRIQLEMIRPALTIGATEAMAKACGGICLPHHHRGTLKPEFVSAQVHTVVYEGSERYLGRWAEWVTTACEKRGWRFVVNPVDIRYGDIIVALRDGPWDGWMCREWKSGVKLVNAIAAGRPIITQDSAAGRELHPFGSVIESRAGLEDAFDGWAPEAQRLSIRNSAKVVTPTYAVHAIAARFKDILRGVLDGASLEVAR